MNADLFGGTVVCLWRLHAEARPLKSDLGVKGAATYKLLGRGDKIERGDEVLADDTVNWLPLVGWEVGMEWGSNLMPVRRRTDGVKAQCWCHTCRPLGPDRMEMVVCPDCGCKRCPRAKNHASACTGRMVAANAPSGMTHICSGCEEARARLAAAVAAAGVAPSDQAQQKGGR